MKMYLLSQRPYQLQLPTPQFPQTLAMTTTHCVPVGNGAMDCRTE